MMASSGQSSAGPGATLHQLLVRTLLTVVVLLAVLDAEVAAGSVRTVAKQTSGSVADVGSLSSELLDDAEAESFEQDVRGGRDALDSWQESESTTVRPDDEDAVTGTTLGYSAVATTPNIVARPVKQLSRYEQGLEDYDEAADRAEREQQQQEQTEQTEQSVEQQYNNMVKPMLTLFNVISTVLSSGRSMRSMATGGGEPGNPGNKTDIITFGEKSTSGTDGTGGGNENETATAVTGGRYIKGDPLNGYYDFVISEGSYKFWVVMQVAMGNRTVAGSVPINIPAGRKRTICCPLPNSTVEGRYIKGDPLNGYYDFIISEGSYKFWAVFQLVTAAVVIYSTLTAIYYSKVAPLTSDYDYIDYLNGGRAFAGARPLDGRPGPATGRRTSGRSWDEALSTSSWFGPAAQAFTIVMDAIERQPK